MKPTHFPSNTPDLRHISLLFFVLLISFILLSCKKTTANSNDSAIQTNLIKSANNGMSTKSLDKTTTFRGLYIFGHEVRSFTPCGDTKKFWAIDKTNGEIISTHTRMTHEPYQQMFVEVRGYLTDTPQDGFGADYDGTIIINELIHASTEGWGCREKYGEFIYKAQGNEPGWTVFITPDEIRFTSINHEDPIVFPYSPPTTPGAQAVYDSSNNKNSIRTILIREQCSNTMSNELFGWSANVNIDGIKYEGCAKKGDL